ncbi:hypothetical protein TESS_TESS_00325 [Tessaracoccus sp. O5.2]
MGRLRAVMPNPRNTPLASRLDEPVPGPRHRHAPEPGHATARTSGGRREPTLGRPRFTRHRRHCGPNSTPDHHGRPSVGSGLPTPSADGVGGSTPAASASRLARTAAPSGATSANEGVATSANEPQPPPPPRRAPPLHQHDTPSNSALEALCRRQVRERLLFVLGLGIDAYGVGFETRPGAPHRARPQRAGLGDRRLRRRLRDSPGRLRRRARPQRTRGSRPQRTRGSRPQRTGRARPANGAGRDLSERGQAGRRRSGRRARMHGRTRR